MKRGFGNMWSNVWSNTYGRLAILLVGFAFVYVFVLLTFPVWAALLSFVVVTQPVWTSLLLAFLFAYLLDPVVGWLEDRGVHRALGILLIVAGLLALLGVLYLLILTVAAQLAALVQELPGLAEGIEELPFILARTIDPSYDVTFQQVFITARAWIDRLLSEALPALQQVDGQEVTQGIMDVLGGGFQAVVILVLTIFFLYRFHVYAQSFLLAVPTRHRGDVREVTVELGHSVGGYIRGQLVIAGAVGLLSWIGLALIGIPLAPALGAFAGILNVIPFFGPLIVSIPTFLLGMTLGWPYAVGALVVLFAVNQIDAHVLTPIVFARTVAIDPATIIVAIFLGTVLFGILGAILAVPAAVMLRFFYERYYLGSDWYRDASVEAPPDPEPRQP